MNVVKFIFVIAFDLQKKYALSIVVKYGKYIVWLCVYEKKIE